jgi:4-amino-4-deoxy-L-arabinose transferase-like glycosyltransferase
MVTFIPSQIVYVSVMGTETLFTFLLLFSLLLLTRITPENSKKKQLLLTGIVLGYAMLVRAVAVLLPVVFIAFLFWRIPREKRLSSLAAFVLGVTVVISPWLIRNVVVMGTPSLSTSGGVNFRIGNGPGATGEWRNFAPGDPILSYEGEAARDRAGYTLTLKDVALNPMRVIKLVPHKMSLLWWSDESGIYWSLASRPADAPRLPQARIIQLNDAIWKWFLALSVAGIVLAWVQPRKNQVSILLTAILGYWLVIHAVLIANDRFHMPIIPILGIFMVFGVMTATKFISRASEEPAKSDVPDQKTSNAPGKARGRSLRARKRGHT